MKVISTREMIETLQKYEKNYGVGIIIGFSNDIVEPNYTIKIPISMVSLNEIFI